MDGRTTVFVPLRDHAGFAAIDAPDFDRLTACGLSADWFVARDAWGSAHVQAPSSNARHYPVLRVARLVTGAAPHQRVRFLDGDRFNLRRANLRVCERGPVLLNNDNEGGSNE